MTFRVQRGFLDNSVLLRLSGDIAGDHGVDLQALLDAERSHGLILDLAEVAVVDRTGVGLLARIESSGARLMNCPAYVREWIDRQREGFDRREAVSRAEDHTMTHGTNAGAFAKTRLTAQEASGSSFALGGRTEMRAASSPSFRASTPIAGTTTGCPASSRQPVWLFLR